MEGENVYYNYILCNPNKKGFFKIPTLDIILPCEPFYVGKGKGRRSKNHFFEVKNNLENPTFFKKNNNHRKYTIKQIIESGLKPIVCVFNKGISSKEACENEKYLINVLGRRDLGKGFLTNLTDGGEGSKGHKPSEEFNKSRSKKMQSGEWKTTKGYDRGEKSKNALSIVVYHIESKNLSFFDSKRDFIGKGGTKNPLINKISSVCLGRRQSCGGYIFMYQKDYSVEILNERINLFHKVSNRRKAVNIFNNEAA